MIRTTRVRPRPTVLTVAAVLLTAASSTATAGVTKYFVQTSGGFFQSGPNSLEYFGGIATVGLGGEGSGQFLYGEVGLPSGQQRFTGVPDEGPDPNDPNLTLFTAVSVDAGSDLATPASLDAKYGPGDYRFLLSGGALDGLSDTLTAGPRFLYADQSPRLLPSSYSLLAGGGDRGRDLLVEWTGFNLSGQASSMGTLSFLDSLGQLVAQFGVDIASGEFLLPAMTLRNGDHFFLSLDYNSHVEGLSANGVSTAVDNGVGVFVDLNPAAAVPEPATLAAAALGLALLPLARRRAKRR